MGRSKNNFLGRRSVILLVLLVPAVLFAQLQNVGDEWRWVEFTTEVGLPSNRVFNIVETSSGLIWAVTQTGVAWFDGYSWHAITEKDGLPEFAAKAIVQCSNDEVLVLMDNRIYRGGVGGFKEQPLKLDGKGKKIMALAGLPRMQVLAVIDSALYEINRDSIYRTSLPAGLSGQKVLNVLTAPNGDMWINATRGLYRSVGGNWSLVLPTTRVLTIGAFVAISNGRAVVYVDSPRELRGVWEIDPGSPPIHVFDYVPGIVNSVDMNQAGDAVVVFETGKIMVRLNNAWKELSNRPIQMRDIIFLRFRDNGDVWVGTESALHLYTGSSSRWTYWVSDKMDERMSTNEILEARDSTIWVARGVGIELHKRDGSTDIIERIHGKPISAVTGLAQDGDGNIWISSGGGFEGAYRWDGKEWKRFGLKEGLAARYIHRVAIDRQGRPWFLGLVGYENRVYDDNNGPGAFVYDHGSFTQWGQSQGLLPGRVYAFAEGLQGEYWFGTSKGLCRWKDGRWNQWTTSSGLKRDRVFALAVDNENRLWFGDQNAGLGMLSGDSLRYYSTSDGLISNAVWDVRADARGRLWIGTRGGLSSYYKGEWIAFGPSSGLSRTRLWPVLPTKNHVFLGTTGGGTAILNIQNEAQHAAQVVPSAPIVEEGNVLLRWNAYSYFGEIGHRDVETRYRLDDGPLSVWTRGREVTLSNISPGIHTFHIQAKGLFGVHDSSGQKILFNVPFPLYRHPVFVLPIGALSLGLLILLVVHSARKKRFDRALRASEARYRSVVEDQSEFIVRFLPDGTRTFVNNAYCRYHGKSSSTLIGRNIFEEMSPEDRERFRQQIAQLTQANPAATCEDAVITPGGEVLWHQWTDRAIFDGESVVEFQSVGRDITERKHAEEALRESEERLRLALMAANQGLYDLNIQTGEAIVSDEYVRMLGYEPDEFQETNAKWRERLHPDDAVEVARAYEDYIAGLRDEYRVEFRQRTKSDGWKWILSLGKIVELDGGGKPVRMLGTHTDITQRKHAEGALRESEERFSVLSEAAFEGIVITDKGRIIDANEQLCAMFGSERSEMIGASVAKFVAPESLELVMQHIRSGKEDPYEHHSLRKDGTSFPVETRAKSIPYKGRLVRVTAVRDITESKRAEQALRQSEENYRNLVENANDAIFIFRPEDECILEVNNRACEMYGFSKEEFVGMSLKKVSRDVRRGEEDIRLTLHDGRVRDIETIHSTKDSSLIDVLINASVVEYNGSDAILSIHRDITDRKRVEDALSKSEQRFRTLFESMTEGVALHELVYDTKGSAIDYRILDVNPSYERHTGLKADMVRGTLASSAYHSAKPPYFDEYVHVAESGESYGFETYFPPLQKYFRIGAFSPRKGLFATVFEDVTERRQMEAALQETNERLQALINSSPLVIHMVDKDGLMQLWNPASERLFGWTASEVLGRYNPVIPQDKHEEFMSLMARTVQGESVIGVEVVRQRKGGSLVNVSLSTSTLRDAAGAVKGFMAVIEDITERKKAEELIKASLREKEVMLKEIHHRVKNNLQVISSLLNLQANHIKDQHTLSLFKESQNRVKSMALIHEKLYQSEDLANIDFGNYVQNLTGHLYRSYVIDPAVVTLHVDFEEVHLKIDKAIPCGLIINELVSNSLKYAFPQGRAGKVSVRLDTDEDSMLTLTVSDNGVGLPEAFNIRRSESLGLQLVSSLADQLDAVIDLNRRGGTEYRITFHQ